MKKRLCSLLLTVCLLFSCAFTMSACGENDNSAKVMNLSLNPEIEFILDQNDKVVSVNALNEDGNHIISISIDTETAKSAFEGMTAEQAVELFLKITEENGYLITGDQEEIEIEISGNANKLMREVRDKANEFFNKNGLNVEIETDRIDKEDIVVRTTSDGAFVATNILASVSHEIIFSKEGWDSKSITIDDFEPLEERQIGLNKEFVLKDTTAPVINDVVINQGANFANKTNLSVEIFADEKGSLVDKMSVQVIASAAGIEKDIYPSTPSWQDYKVGFDFDLDDLPDSIYTGNGTYTLVVTLKDKAGNVSESVSDSISITDVVTSLAGVLTGDNLHLVKERSPYLVEADCMVRDGTLVIDPGVEVRFAGAYSITLDDGIKAVGTEEEKIIFTSDVVDEEYTYTTTEWGTYIDENGKGHKPFVVPQHTPDFYLHSMKSYNVPEFIKEPVELDRRMIIETAKEGQALKVAAQ